jgi:hypothetical protein
MFENLAQPSLDEIVEFRNFESSTRGINIGVSCFAIIATSAYKKDQWKRTINQLFSKPCCNIIRVFEDYATKSNG